MVVGVLFSFTVYCLFYGRMPGAALYLIAAMVLAATWRFRRRHRHSFGFLSMDRYAQQSGLCRCHPGLKVCFCLLCVFLCTGADTIGVSLFVALGMAVFAVGPGRTPLRCYLALLTVPAVFILLGTVAILVEVSPAPMGLLDIPLGPIYLCVTRVGQATALRLICRALGAVSCLYLLGLSTPMHQLIGFLRRIRVPAIVIELMYLIYRYIFLLLETLRQMQTAAGARLGYRDWRTSVKTLGGVSLNLLFLSFRRSADCLSAMESRCYDGEIDFLQREGRLRAGEVAAAGFFVAAIILMWYLVGGMG